MTEPQQPDQRTGQQVAEVLLTGAAAGLLVRPVFLALRPFGVTREAVALALALAERGTKHQPRMVGRAQLTRDQRREEANYRAWYVIAAAGRITAARKAGVTPREAVAKERPYWAAHEKARKARMAAAAAVVVAAARFGPVLGWWAHPDDKVTPECAAANGRNFPAARRPQIGWPGQPHGGNCRCWAGPPFADGPSVDEVTARLAH